MRVVLLGAAAGGGFPQWNCSCTCCSVARSDPELAHPRTQSSVAVQAASGHWFLVNASPDVHAQLERRGLLAASDGPRGPVVEAVLVTNADLDHCLGLFLLREGEPLQIVCRPTVRTALTEGLGLTKVLSAYCGSVWAEAAFTDRPLLDRNGLDTDLIVRAVPANGGPPRYFQGTRSADGGDSVGFMIADRVSGKSVLVLPDVDAWTDTIEQECRSATLVLFDGTFWSEDELPTIRPGARSASQMGHLPISGPEGSLSRLASSPAPTKVYIHINNTNPVLLENSPQRAEVENAGIEVGDDGMTWIL